METRFIEERIKYDGSQLSPHWIYRNFSILGDAVVSFTGECRVELSHMVDLVDVKSGQWIYSPLMLHFIVEKFDTDLERAVLRQRMLITIIKEWLEERLTSRVIRRGDDLFVGEGKLSVSIATVSLASTLIHVGLNIDTEGTPVKTVGLKDLGIIDARQMAQDVMSRFREEMMGIYLARCKVRGVGL
ncbi:DUF366 family protein [Syntrophothermus lipocalidus]|uniref:DUF366 domain-containing protein n=1 Tax=Syntrophothermus lipocalidus (strain DSM 12680 / TGB-C1) TaxID=643648 RepID=D7CMQ1_SYNLT|nr:DUF366 family protein [Syntrophothermus lipocalidus]ADI01986.1 protein of unknown function DUF366 [Syntrophothermus lipocalidus DSM 12680]